MVDKKGGKRAVGKQNKKSSQAANSRSYVKHSSKKG